MSKKEKKPSALVKVMGMLISCEKKKLIFGIILSVIGAVAMLFAPLVLKRISEIILNDTTGTSQANNPEVVAIVWTCIGLFAGGALFSYAQTWIVAGVCARGSERLRNMMTKKINTLPLNYFDTRNIGDILSYVSNDVDILGTTINNSFSMFISSVVTLLGSVIILFVLDWRIAVVVLILLPVGLLILSKVGSSSEKYFLERQNTTSGISSEAEQAYTGYNIIRVFKANGIFRKRFAEKNDILTVASDKAEYYSGVLYPIMIFFGNILFAGVALMGGLIAASFAQGDPARNAAIATIVAAVSYAEQLISPLSTIAQTAATLQQTSAAATRIDDFLTQIDEPDESEKTVTLNNIEGHIAFEHVRFGYTKDRVIIHDFSEVGKPGQKIAIVGPTGAGKTTMVNLLMRFYELNSGRITIEGVDTREMNRSYVRSLFGMVLQDTWLFEGTIMENLKYSRPEATDEEVYEACRATHCDTFIRQQPGGYNHVLNEDCGLSSGQKQLLTIARAMIQNAPMLILDEATSSVDTRTELQIQDAMDKLMKGRTSFVIAHRLSTIKNSNLIIVMKDGDVLETGNHDELMKLDGFYAQLYNSQFTGKGPQFS